MKHFYLKHIFLCLCLFAGINAFAYDAEIDGIYYNFSGNEAEVTYISLNEEQGWGYITDYSGDVVIPQSVTDDNGKTYNVTSIGEDAFYYCDGLTSVSIPNSVTSINSGAFCGCSSLTSIIIPDGVTFIGSSAFYQCSGLKSVTIGNCVKIIGSAAFMYCI